MAERVIPQTWETPEQGFKTGYSSPAEKKFTEWYNDPNRKPGDIFDWTTEVGGPENVGLSSRFEGLNKDNKATISTLVTPERQAALRQEMVDYRARMAAFKPTIGAMADGKPIYGFDQNGNPVTDPKGIIYSTLSPQDAITKFKNGDAPVSGVVTATTSPTAVSSTTITATTATTASNATLKNPYMPGTEEFKAFGERESAYNLLYQQMAAYGLQSLVEPLKNLVLEGVSPSEFTLRLRDTAAYRQRFGANQARINKGLRALSEAEYIGLEDQYQNVMRRYGLPASFYTRGELGRQEGFEKFIAGDVSPVELEDRVQTAYNRVINANPEVSIALRTFYPGITNGDILAYALDPERSLNEINRKITAAEIGGAAVQSGLTTNESDAEYLARYGITKEQAQQGYRTISGYLPTAQKLSSIYGNQVTGGAYTQASAEREIFGTPGAAEEERKRRQLTSLEEAAFSGRSGLTGGALARDRAGSF